MDELEDFDAPDRMELVAGSDCLKKVGFCSPKAVEREVVRCRITGGWGELSTGL